MSTNLSVPLHPYTRRSFLKTGCRAACLVATVGSVGTLVSSCYSAKYVAVKRNGGQLEMPVTDMKDAAGNPKRYAVLEHDSLNFPVVVFQNTPGSYTAFLLKCTHQGNELQAGGEYLVCNAHGSEFDSRGHVKQGPATQNLRPLPVEEREGIIRVTL